jgi:inner membrane protein
MDSITHIALGACIGEVFLGKKLGKRAMLWGALAQSAPDIDFVASFWMHTADDLLAHRGFTHSIVFAILITPLFALLADRWHRPHDTSLKRFILFFGVEIFGHLFLDGFNNYGTGWLEPFTHQRFSFNAVYVADPLFSIWIVAGTLMMIFMKNDHRHRVKIVRYSISLSCLYLMFCIINKVNIDRQVRHAFERQNIPAKQYFTTPTALNNFLWYVVAGNDSGFYVGFRSILDRTDSVRFTYFPRNEHLLDSVDDREEVAKLKRFSQGFYTVEKSHDTLVMNDLRFGQIIGWKDPNEKFVFHYFLDKKGSNELVVQRGRLAKMDRDAVVAMLRRMKGI